MRGRISKYFKASTQGLPQKENNDNFYYGYPFLLLLPHDIRAVERNGEIHNIDWRNPETAFEVLFDRDGRYHGNKYYTSEQLTEVKLISASTGFPPSETNPNMFNIDLDLAWTAVSDTYNAGDFKGIISYEGYIYVTKGQYLYKVNPADYKIASSLDLGATAVGRLKAHNGFIYVANSNDELHKINAETLASATSISLSAINDFDISFNGDLFVLHDSLIIERRSVLDLALITTRTLTGVTFNCMKTSGSYVYVVDNFNENLFKLNKEDLTDVDYVSVGETVRAMCFSGKFGYLALGSQVARFNAEDMTYADMSNSSFTGNVTDLQIIDNYIYAIGNTSPQVKKINLKDFTLVSSSNDFGSDAISLGVEFGESYTMKTLGMLSDVGGQRDSEQEEQDFRNAGGRLIIRLKRATSKSISLELAELGDIEVEHFIEETKNNRFLVVLGQVYGNKEIDSSDWFPEGTKFRYRLYPDCIIKSNGASTDRHDALTTLPIQINAIPLSESVARNTVVIKDYVVGG